MSRNSLRIGAFVLVGMLVVGALAWWAIPGYAQGGYGGRQGGVPGPALANPLQETCIVDEATERDVSPSEVEALLLALDDEYKAWSVYDQVIADLGAVRPFTQIVQAEDSHIAALVTLFDRYGVEVPPNDWPGNVPTYASRAEACAGGVQAEIDNAALYDDLFAMVDNPDIVRVFTALQQASLTKHLPAFESCAP